MSTKIQIGANLPVPPPKVLLTILIIFIVLILMSPWGHLIIVILAWTFDVIERLAESVMAGVFCPLIGLIRYIQVGVPDSDLADLLLSAVAGIITGIVIAIIRAWGCDSPKLRPFISSAMNKDLVTPLRWVFLGRVIIGGFVGLLAGLACGSAGAPSVMHLFSGTTHELLTSHSYPLHEIIYFSSGTGGGGGFEYIVSLLIVVFVLILMGIVTGVVSGYATQIFMTMISGLVKGSTQEWVTAVVEEGMTDSYGKPLRVRAGAIRGLWTGFVTGILMAISTITDIIRFY